MNYQTIIFLGRQPKLSLAELESLFGDAAIADTFGQIALLDIESGQVPFYRLGGSTKLAKVLTVLDSTKLADIEKFLAVACVEHVQQWPEGKLSIGVSVYGLDFGQKQIEKLGLNIKKAVKRTGRNVRLVPTYSQTLNDAQVLHNKLHSKGWELCLVRRDNQTIIAQTVAIQDLDAYTYRDRSRPARDAKVGMLPPKLAQIIINLACPKLEDLSDEYLLDPFCGTGVINIEAYLMGLAYRANTDLEPRMVKMAADNGIWANKKLTSSIVPEGGHTTYEPADACSANWLDFLKDVNQPVSAKPEIGAVACETFLGEAYFKLPELEQLEQNITNVNHLLSQFLRNLASQTRSGTRMCIAVPAWAVSAPRSKLQDLSSSFKHLPLLDSLEEFGYNRLDFKHARRQDLIYHRPGQVVARELLVLVRK